MLVALGVFGTLVGLLNGNPGSIANTTIYVIEPAILGILLPVMCARPAGARFLLHSLDLALIAVALSGLLVFMQLPLEAVTGKTFNAIDLGGGAIRTNYQGYNTLVFLAPYGLIRALSRQSHPEPSSVKRIILAFAAVSGIVLSGRHILYLEVPIALLCALLSSRLARTQDDGHQRGSSRVVVAVAGGLSLLALAVQAIGLTIFDAISRTISQITIDDPSGARPLQASLLLQQWQHSPIIGQGSGADIAGYARSVTQPWQFELTYHSLLMQFGVVGAVILGAFILWILRNLVSLCRWRCYSVVAVQAGFVGTVLACSVDPYVFTSAGIWMFFVPFALAGLSRMRSIEYGSAPRAEGASHARMN